MPWLRQSQGITVQIGPFLDKDDGVIPETELTDMTVELSAGGSAFSPRHSSTEIEHDSAGWYRVHLDATDTSHLGPLQLRVQDSAYHLPVWDAYQVVAVQVYDALVTAGDALPVNVVQVGGESAADLYQADIHVTIDDVNGLDEYTVAWFKNGLRIASGIASPKLHVIRRSDATDLIAATTAMTQIETTGLYKYSTSIGRLTPGEAAAASVTAVIDGSTRSFTRLVSRDSQ